MDLGKNVCDVAPSYSAWRLNWVTDLVLPPIDDMVEPGCLFLEKMPTEAEILRSKIEAERKATNLKILRLQEDLGNVTTTWRSSKIKFIRRIKSMISY